MNESIQLWCCGCPALAQHEYLHRHDNVAKVVHQALAKKYGFANTEQPYYKCKPDSVLINENAKLLWNYPMITDPYVEANRPDIILTDKKACCAIIIDVAVPLDDNVVNTVAEKKRKYQPLAVEIKHMYQLREVTIVPVVVSANGVVTDDWAKAAKKLGLEKWHVKRCKKLPYLELYIS